MPSLLLLLPHYWCSQWCRIGCCFKLSFTECLSSRRSQTTYTQSEIYLGRLGTQVISTYPPLFCRLPKHGQTKMHAWNTKKIETEFELCLDLHNTSLQFIHKMTPHITPFLGRLITRLDLHFAILHQMTKLIQSFTLDTGTKYNVILLILPFSVISHIFTKPQFTDSPLHCSSCCQWFPMHHGPPLKKKHTSLWFIKTIVGISRLYIQYTVSPEAETF